MIFITLGSYKLIQFLAQIVTIDFLAQNNQLEKADLTTKRPSSLAFLYHLS